MSRWRLKVKRMKKVSWPAKTTDDWAILIVFVNSSEKKNIRTTVRNLIVNKYVVNSQIIVPVYFSTKDSKAIILKDT